MKSNNEKDVQFILDLKENIDESKTKKSRFEGQLDELIANLKSKFGLTTVDQAKKSKADKMAKLDELELEFKEVIDKLKDIVKE